MQDMCLLDELDPIHPFKRKLSRDQRNIRVSVCQPGERLECCLRGRNYHYLVVLPEAAFECRLDGVPRLQVRIHDK